MFIAYNGKTPYVHPSAFVAPTAVLIGDVEVAESASIWFGAVIRGDNGPIRIGARSNVQDNAVLHVSENNRTIIGTDVTIGHCATMEDCTIEDGALVGTNSVVLNGATVGRRSLIAAGSVVAAGATIPLKSSPRARPPSSSESSKAPASSGWTTAAPSTSSSRARTCRSVSVIPTFTRSPKRYPHSSAAQHHDVSHCSRKHRTGTHPSRPSARRHHCQPATMRPPRTTPATSTVNSVVSNASRIRPASPVRSTISSGNQPPRAALSTDHIHPGHSSSRSPTSTMSFLRTTSGSAYDFV